MIKYRETYGVTRGVENEGYNFEVAMLAFYSMQLCYNDQIPDFQIAIYEEHYRPFDDIVISVKTQLEEKYAFQLKHVKDKLDLTSGHFSPKGKLELNKYFKKYEFSGNTHIILLTNGVVAEEMNVGSFSIKPKKSLSTIEKILDTSAEECDRIYEISKDECEHKITFYTSQKNCQEIEALVVRKLKQTFSVNDIHLKHIFKKLKEFFEIWKKDCKEIGKLDKQDIKMKIAEIFFYQHTVHFSPVFTDTIIEKVNVLQNLVNEFNVTLLHGTSASEIQNLCHIDLNQRQIIEAGKNYLIFPKSNKNWKEICTILWRLKKFPLVVKIDDTNKNTIYKVIGDIQEENLSFILLGENLNKWEIPARKVFHHLKDLEDYKELAERFKVSIQGRGELSLKTLIEHNNRFLEIISLNELLVMLKSTLNIGGCLEDLPTPYVSRRVLTTLLKSEVFTKNPNDLFIVSGDQSTLKSLKEKLFRRKNYHFYDYENMLADKVQTYPSRTLILAYQDIESPSEIGNCSRNTHYIKVFDSEHLQWIYSLEKSDSLCKYRITLNEDQLHENLKNKINLICSRSGMGKLILLRFLKNNCPPDYWTEIVNFQEHRTKKNQEDFELHIRSCFEEKKRLIYFFYGLDNLQHDKLDDAVNYIKETIKKGFRVWIFAEDYIRERLEDALNVVSMSIQEWSEEEQQQYMKDRLKGNGQEEQLEKLRNIFEMLRDNDILGVPFHMYMLTEISITNQKIIKGNLILTDIYRYFIESKYHQYLLENNCNLQNQIVLDGKYYRNEQYKLAAVKSNLKKLALHCDNNFLNQIRRTGDILGIISEINCDGTVTFSRRTYAHFFAALWLTTNHQNIENLQDFIFHEDHRNMFFMFNLELTRDNPLHVAVLYQNYEQVQKNRNRLQELDPVGRTPLHLACSNGMKYSRLEACSDEEYTIKENMKEDIEIIKIIDYLVERMEIDPVQKDSLLGWDLFDYACKTLNLYALEKILPIKRDLSILDRFAADMATIAYYSVKFGYENLLKLIVDHGTNCDILNKNYNGETLLHLAVKTGRFSIVKLLLEGGADFDSTTATHYKRSALHLAAEYQEVNIMELLLKYEASIETMDRIRNSPLHVSASKGDLEAMKLLVRFGADINFSDNFGRTALHRAASKGHVKSVLFLLDNGAKADCFDKFGKTALDCAKDKRHKRAVKLLIKKGAIKTNKRVHRRSTRDELHDYVKRPLHWACINGNTDDIDGLLKENVSINDLDDHYGRTPLFGALLKGHANIVQMLIRRGASVNIADKRNFTPLHWAINNENVEMVQLFLSSDARIDVVDSFHYTPLHWAAMQGNVEIVKLLLARDPNTDVVDTFGMKPIDWAIEMGHYETTKLLSKEDSGSVLDLARKRTDFLENYEHILFKINDCSGHNPLHYAVYCGYLSFVKKYLEQGRNVDEADQFGYTPLHKAILKRHKNVIELLLKNGAKVNAANSFNITPLHLVVFKGSIDNVKLLLRYSPQLDAFDNFRCTPLHLSAMKGFFRTCQLLIEAGADVNTVDVSGNTPLDSACKKGHVKTVRVLLKNNAEGKMIRENHLELAKKQNAFFKI